jgi:hypothetical protein
MDAETDGAFSVSLSRSDDGTQGITFLMEELSFDESGKQKYNESGVPVETHHLAVISANEARLLCMALNRLIQEIEETRAAQIVDNL